MPDLRRELPRRDAARADGREGARPKRLDLDVPARLRRVDHPAVADVEADVPQAAEEDEVAGAHRGEPDVATDAVERSSVVRQADPEPSVDPRDEAGAVEARG